MKPDMKNREQAEGEGSTNYNIDQARLIAIWMMIALEGAAYLESHGEKRHAENMREAVEKLIFLTADDIGRQILATEMFMVLADRESKH